MAERGPDDVGQLYRGQISMANTWRNRLDRTTNWAVVITAGVSTWSFSSPDRSHAVLLFGMAMVTFFLFIEGRRYRHFEVWRERVRLIEEGHFAGELEPGETGRRNWRELLARDLIEPTHKISTKEALGRRFKRVYVWIIGGLLVAWYGKLWAHPVPAGSLAEMAGRSGGGLLPGGFVLSFVTIGFLAALSVSIWSTQEREAKGELRPKEEKGEGWKE